jgi:hypothetical protein
MKLTDEQYDEIEALLQPGDIVLVFNQGYMSNIFIPGVFKHAITFVGAPGQRHEAGFSGEDVRGIPQALHGAFRRTASKAVLRGGGRADAIEALAPGVVFSCLRERLHKCNLVLVLRPRLTPEQRGQALKELFRFVGCPYDFKFDFSDASHNCCTEVIYRAINRRGPINMQLVRRFGRQTLSADDIVTCYLTSPTRPFDMVLLAEKHPGPLDHGGRILKGPEAEGRLRAMMNVVSAE